MLTGKALAMEARRLQIPGRSKMSADQLRTAIATEIDNRARTVIEEVWGPDSVPQCLRVPQVPQVPDVPQELPQAPQVPQGCPITGVTDCRDRRCELHYMSAPLSLPGPLTYEMEDNWDPRPTPPPFRTRNGKHKRSAVRRNRPRYSRRYL